MQRKCLWNLFVDPHCRALPARIDAAGAEILSGSFSLYVHSNARSLPLGPHRDPPATETVNDGHGGYSESDPVQNFCSIPDLDDVGNRHYIHSAVVPSPRS
jgi:hypothetical protein